MKKRSFEWIYEETSERFSMPQTFLPQSALLEPLTDDELDELQARLDHVPEPLEPLDVSMIDGFLCGVLLQPRPVPVEFWLPYITDVDGRPLPTRFDTRRLDELVQRRHAELQDAIQRRQWFDPWVFELDDEGANVAERSVLEDSMDEGDDEDADPPPVDAVYPWVAGFATALEVFPDFMALNSPDVTEPLALLYRHLDASDLEDADELLAEIETLEPPVDISEAVECLVRATLLLADVSRPVASGSARTHAGRAANRSKPRSTGQARKAR
jgi:uncharacterized protein